MLDILVVISDCIEDLLAVMMGLDPVVIVEMEGLDPLEVVIKGLIAPPKPLGSIRSLNHHRAFQMSLLGQGYSPLQSRKYSF